MINSQSNLIKSVLKNEFNYNFSVKKRHYDTYNVTYVDGISEDKVEEVLSKLEKGFFDPSQDLYIYNNKSNTAIAKYIFVDRKMSEETKKEILEEIKRDWGDNIENLSPVEQYKKLGMYLEQLIYKIFRKRDYPFKKLEVKKTTTKD